MLNKSTPTHPLTFTVITDTHYYSVINGSDSPAYNRENAKNQKLLKDSGAVLRCAFNQMAEDEKSDIILLSGDTTNNGEYDSHKEFIELLRELKTKKRVYVLTATHDYQDDGKTFKFTGDQKEEIPAPKREELYEMYREFGPDESIALHRESMSYIIQLSDGYRLFALNDDTNKAGKSGFSDELFEWIKLQAEDAKANNQIIIPMTHHPMIAPSDFFAIIGKNDMMGDHEKRLNQFADMGINFIFTGHSHMHDISCRFSEKENAFIDISTSSLIGYPGLYRRVTIEPSTEKIKIESLFADENETLSFDGESLKKHLENQFFGMIGKVIDAAATDLDRLADMVQAFSVKKSVIYKFGWLMRPFAKLLKKLKIKTVAKWTKKETGLTRAEIENLKNEKVLDFVITLPMNLYKGDAQYEPSSPYYKITMGLLAILDSFLQAIHLPIEKLLKDAKNLRGLVEPLLYNFGIPAANVDLPLYPDRQKIQSLYKEKDQPEIKSNKGVGLLLTIILCVIILIPFIPIIAIVLAAGYITNRLRFRQKIKE